MPRAAVASSKANGTKREWCPGSLETPDTLRRSGRTETLTGQASHTSSRAKDRNKGQEQRAEGKGQKYRGSKWRKGIKPGEVKLLRSQIAVSTADAAQRLMALGNQNLYGRFSAANPDRRRSRVCPQETVALLQSGRSTEITGLCGLLHRSSGCQQIPPSGCWARCQLWECVMLARLGSAVRVGRRLVLLKMETLFLTLGCPQN